MVARSNKNTKPISTCSLLLVGGLILLFWLLFGWISYPYDKGVPSFGDAFQALSALFSGFAFVGLIYTALLQKSELSLQREDLNLTRKELEGQRIALNAQSETLKKQNFEDTFFQLLGIQNQIVNSIDIFSARSSHTIRGRDCFRIFYDRLRTSYAAAITAGSGGQRIPTAYIAFYSNNQAEVGHYFRNLYTLIKFVHQSDVQDKKFYTNIVRAQLSSYELLLLFYNCLSPLGADQFKPLVERYSLLAQMPTGEILSPVDMNLYDIGAFQ